MRRGLINTALFTGGFLSGIVALTAASCVLILRVVKGYAF